MKHLKKYNIFESIDNQRMDDIESDVIDILSPISDTGNMVVEVNSYIKIGDLHLKSHPRRSGGVLVLQIDISDAGVDDFQSTTAYVRPKEYKEELERLKEYLVSNGFSFEKWYITDGWDRNWNNLFNTKSFGEEISDNPGFLWPKHWLELYFHG
jgi:hypothetical protein